MKNIIKLERKVADLTPTFKWYPMSMKRPRVNYTYIGCRKVYTLLITGRSLERENGGRGWGKGMGEGDEGGGGKIPYGIFFQFHSLSLPFRASFQA